jgi:hypothetical protein
MPTGSRLDWRTLRATKPAPKLCRNLPSRRTANREVEQHRRLPSTCSRRIARANAQPRISSTSPECSKSTAMPASSGCRRAAMSSWPLAGHIHGATLRILRGQWLARCSRGAAANWRALCHRGAHPRSVPVHRMAERRTFSKPLIENMKQSPPGADDRDDGADRTLARRPTRMAVPRGEPADRCHR